MVDSSVALEKGCRAQSSVSPWARHDDLLSDHGLKEEAFTTASATVCVCVCPSEGCLYQAPQTPPICSG